MQKRSLPPPGDVGPLEEMVEPRPDAGVVVEGEEEEEVRPLLSAFRDGGGVHGFAPFAIAASRPQAWVVTQWL